MRIALWFGCVVMVAGVRTASAQRWQDATPLCLGTTAQWSNKVELADVDGDGKVDILVANGGNYSSGGSAEPSRVWKNLGGWGGATATCSEISAQAVLGFMGSSRMIKVADVDGDGDLDILVGGAWQTQLHLYLREGAGWTDATAQLPQQLTSIGDAEFGDVDGDGDLDIVMADWGAGSVPGQGGRTRLYLNDGTGHFSDVTATQMPAQLVKWSWDMELVDVDNDWDLDIVVSSKASATSYLFRNDGAGNFTVDPDALPHHTNNYEFEPMDIDADGDMDLVTINDGPGGTNCIFVNDGTGHFTDESATRFGTGANPQEDDNAIVWLDVDSDGDPDMLVASLSGPERLLLNDGAGHFTLSPNATPDDTPGSLGIAVADLDGDGRLDVVQSQGEVAFPEKVQIATSMVSVDTAPPHILAHALVGSRVVARVHDGLSPYHAHDFQRVWAVFDGGTEMDLRWYGEYLFAATLPAGAANVSVCARDRAGNQACDGQPLFDDTPLPDGVPGDDTYPTGDAGNPNSGGGGGCCDAGGSPVGAGALFLVAVLSARGRSRRRCSGTSTRDPR